MKYFLPPFSSLQRRIFVSYKQKYVHKILVNHFVKKSVCIKYTDHPDMTIAVDWEVKNQTKPKRTF